MTTGDEGGRRVVWVVDDSPLDAERARRALEPECEVRTFRDGSVVLEELSHAPPPDVLVLDWIMPGVSGIEVCQFLRSPRGGVSNIKILMLTVQQATSQIVQALSAGANDFVSKPWSDDELRARVRAQIQSKDLLERAERAEDGIRKLLANAPDALIAVDAEGVINYANAEATRLLDRPLHEVAGQPLKTVLPAVAADLLAEGTASFADVEIGGRVVSPAVRLMPNDTIGELTVLSLRDVTDRRKAEQRRLDFYSIVAHDVRSPMSAMLLRTEMLLQGTRGELPPAVVSDLRKIQGGIHSLVRMINDFLDLAQFEGSSFRLQEQEVDLVWIVQSTIDELQPLAQARKIALEVQLSPSSVAICGDQRRLAQVMNNLVGNAIKFTPAGGSVEVKLVERPHHVTINVQDTGCGIPPDELPTLWERYVRGRTGEPGTGLGLLIVREIVEAHRGTVGVDSQVGVGSNFWVRLPVVERPGLY
jgi:signal transduction histidine kinase